MKYLPHLSLLLFIVALSACVQQPTGRPQLTVLQALEFKSRYELQRFRNVSVLTSEKICAAPIASEDEDFQVAVGEAMLFSLQRHFAQVSTLTLVERDVSALRSARKQTCQLLLFPTQVERQDKIWSMTEWDEFEHSVDDLGVDELQLRLTLWDVNSEQIMDMAVIKARTGWLDFTDSNSQELVAESIDYYIREIVALR